MCSRQLKQLKEALDYFKARSDFIRRLAQRAAKTEKMETMNKTSTPLAADKTSTPTATDPPLLPQVDSPSPRPSPEAQGPMSSELGGAEFVPPSAEGARGRGEEFVARDATSNVSSDLLDSLFRDAWR